MWNEIERNKIKTMEKRSVRVDKYNHWSEKPKLKLKYGVACVAQAQEILEYSHKKDGNLNSDIRIEDWGHSEENSLRGKAGSFDEDLWIQS